MPIRIYPDNREGSESGNMAKARDADIRLAKKAINGERHYPASYALWYFRPEGDCPAEWYYQYEYRPI